MPASTVEATTVKLHVPEEWMSNTSVIGRCIVEDLLVRGFDEHEVPTTLFALVDDRNRQDQGRRGVRRDRLERR